jgi:hypothetical protein
VGQTTRVAIALWLGAAASQAFAQAEACKYAVEPRASASPSSHRLSLVAMTPPEGADVRRDTILAVDVDFDIAGFEPKTYWLYAIFPMNTMGSAGADSMVPEGLHVAAGRARLCIPLKDIYAHSMVRWPLTMQVTVHKLRGAGSEIVAYTAPIKLKAVEVPAEALERQAAAPDDEYYDSLKKVTEFFNSRLARYKICIERFPAMQPQMTPAYRAWETRHREQIDLVSRVQFDMFKVMAKGNAGIAASIEDDIRNAALEAYRKAPEAQFSQQCKIALEDFADTEDLSDLAISDEIELIRQQEKKTAEQARSTP